MRYFKECEYCLCQRCSLREKYNCCDSCKAKGKGFTKETCYKKIIKKADISEDDFKKALKKATKIVSKSKRGEEKRFIRDLISFVGYEVAKELDLIHCWCGPLKYISDNKVKCLFSCEPDEDSDSINFDVDLTIALGTDDKNRIWSKYVRFTPMYIIKDSKFIKKLQNGTQFYKENNIEV